MNRTEKQAFVAELHATLNQANSLVVTHYNGLNVAAISELRRRMRASGATFRVTKNRLTRLALPETPYAGLEDLFVGPTAIAYADDPIAPAKVAVEFAKTNDNLVVLGGAMGGNRLDADGVRALAALPSLDELRAKLIGVIQAPATKLAGVIQAPAAQLARVLQAHAQKDAA